MPVDFSVIVNVRHQFGPTDDDVGVYAGEEASFSFDCPGVSRGDDAILVFQSQGVGVEQDLLVNGVRVFGGLPANPTAVGGASFNVGGEAAPHTHDLVILNFGWVGNIMIVASGVLQETGNRLQIASNGDSFIVDNVIMLYKIQPTGAVVASPST